MTREECKKFSNQFDKGEEIEKLINSQIDTFFDIVDSDYKIQVPNYNIGDDVVLNKNHYLHGIGNNMDAINIINENGIVSKEANGLFGNHAFQFVVGLWRVKDNISLSDYIKNYSGIVASYEENNEQVPYGKLDEFVEKMRNVDHWLWNAESSMEIRFMPSLARDINQVGFIINIDEMGKKLIENDINSINYNKKISTNFLRSDKTEDFFYDKNNNFLERASYVIFGIPKNFLEGIIVGRTLEQDNNALTKLKKQFPNCYICNLDGKIILN